ncbi:hypothetical protein VN97_g9420 [Penicillium thymicola]|uniref:Uncharacterized protein n=1 Tax=Penicillium thymicola TaxID=293382 RepID=A0AAI9TCD9_PENTH|nr:hypothetical protein VN97_g9420 [Penicillium thymicola]
MITWQLDGSAGPPFAVLKYLCHSAADSNKKAIMRIYLQIPIEGTEFQRPEVRQRQAAPPRKHRELDVLKDLTLRKCPVVPSLLAYKQGKQGSDGLVPDGYITHILWDKVPGKELNQDMVWDRKSGPLREAVRAKFRDVSRCLGGAEAIWMAASRAWTGEYHLRRGYEDDACDIFYMPSDEQNRLTIFRHITGFRTPAPFKPEKRFTEVTFAEWGLAIPPNKTGWEQDITQWAW